MSMDFSVADKMANIGTAKRQEMDKAGRFGRASALIGSSDSSQQNAAPQKTDGNVVEAEMNTQEAQDRFAPIFEQLHEAVEASCGALQKLVEGVQSEKEQDASLVQVLNDLTSVVQNIRDSRQDIMSQIADAPAAPDALKP